MVQVMILRDVTRFTMILAGVMLPLAVGLSWRFHKTTHYYNFERTVWSFMLTFVDAGSSPLMYFAGSCSSVL
jgi:hypothetical protein